LIAAALLLAEQLRRLRHVGRDPPSVVFRESQRGIDDARARYLNPGSDARLIACAMLQARRRKSSFWILARRFKAIQIPLKSFAARFAQPSRNGGFYRRQVTAFSSGEQRARSSALVDHYHHRRHPQPPQPPPLLRAARRVIEPTLITALDKRSSRTSKSRR
jgi:hypothetical protein